jgi:pimeloyl-ACP methyl ester carboxylesterase
MYLLGRRLARDRFDVDYFSYSPLVESHEEMVERMIVRLGKLAAAKAEVGLVGHSFGGLLFREALGRVPELNVRHLIMLGTPHQPPRLARIYQYPPFNLFRGRVAEHLGNRRWYSTLPPIAVPYTIVSGTKGWSGKLSPFESEPNDGIVAVSETVLSERDRPILVPSIHTFLMNNRVVSELIVKKLTRP